MCPILLEIYQKHTNNLWKIVFIFLNNRREETENHSVSPGLRLSLLVEFFPLLWLDVSHTGCSITSHKFLMSHSPVTFNCVAFLLPHRTWRWRWWRWRQQWDPSQARWQRPLYNESFVELWSCGAPSPLNEGWVLGTRPCQPAPAPTPTFLIWKTFQWNSTAGQPQVVAPMSTYIFITSLSPQ